MRSLSMPKLKSYAQGQTILITLENERGRLHLGPERSEGTWQPMISRKVARNEYNNSHSVLRNKRIPMILNILKKYKKFIFLGAIVDGQVMTQLDLELYTTLDHSVYNKFLGVINYNKFIIDDHKLITKFLFPIHHSIAILTAMLSGPVLVRAAKHAYRMGKARP